jgi:hypothetical protein
MYIERPKALFQPCIIKPLDDQEGLIVRIRFDKCGAEVLVRYFVFSQVVYNWFYDFDIELKEPKTKQQDFFRG